MLDLLGDVEAFSLEVFKQEQLGSVRFAPDAVVDRIQASSETGAGNGLVQFHRPHELLQHPVALLFAGGVHLLAMQDHCFTELDDCVGHSSLVLPCFEEVIDQRASDSGTQDENHTGIEGRHTVSSKEAGTGQQTKEREADSNPGYVTGVRDSLELWLNIVLQDSQIEPELAQPSGYHGGILGLSAFVRGLEFSSILH